MEWHQLDGVPRKPVIIDLSQPQPPAAAIVPGMKQTLTIMPAAEARARFAEMNCGPRNIPPAIDKVFIEPGWAGYAMTACVFVLPEIGETGALNGKEIEILNLTHNGGHAVISPRELNVRIRQTYEAKKLASVEQSIAANAGGRQTAGKWTKDRTRAEFENQYDLDHPEEVAAILKMAYQE